MSQISNLYSGDAVFLEKSNVDTDQIIPKQYLKSIKKTGLGPFLFDAWRFEDEGYLGKKLNERIINKEFILNRPIYKNINILIAQDNFGCGSSREHAVWALKDYGINTIIAPSFGDIFFNNCFKNGILAIKISSLSIDKITKNTSNNFPLNIEIDLVNQSISCKDLFVEKFSIDSHRKKCLIEGLDEIGYSLKYEKEISNYEEKIKVSRPWIINE